MRNPHESALKNRPNHLRSRLLTEVALTECPRAPLKQHNMHHTFLLASVLGLGCIGLTQAQWSSANDPNHVEWTRANEAYDNHQYALALHLFEDLMAQSPNKSSESYAQANYHAALSALALFHKDAVYRVESFIQEYPESPMALEARWALANHQYKRKNYSFATEQFLLIRPRELSKERRNEYRFKLGHCYFERENYEAARVQLFDVLKVESEFQAPARYYFSHIAYINGKPQVALDGFDMIADHPDFRELVPLYIAQLLHETGQFERLKSYGPPLLTEASGLSEESRAEVARLVGDIWYREGEFTTASPYLEQGWEGADGPGRNPAFAYQMGYTRYMLKDWRGALDCFPLASRGDDELAQNAIYHMADCYMQMGDRARAKQAFRTASEPVYDVDIQEDAFFHYAKLAYELSFNPFDDAIVAFESYLQQFPASPRRDEAYRFLLQVYMTSRDYNRALSALDKIGNPDQTMLAAAEVLAFNQGVELFQAKQLNQSLEAFKKCRSFQVDPQIHAETFYWEAEILYNKGKYTQAAAAYAQFSKTPGSYLSPLHNDADYARGYAHYKSERYTDALTAFRSYLESHPEDDASRMRDAELRTADCFYALKAFTQAAEMYDRVLNRGIAPLDYPLFQRAMAARLSDDLEGQIDRLDQLLAEHPQSRLRVEALYEAAKSHIDLEQLADARTKLQAILDHHGATPRAKDALVDLCLVGVKQGDSEFVLATWDRIRTDYGSDNAASDAYNIVEPLLIERGLLDNLPPAVGLDGAEIEKRFFESASYLALENRCSEAIPRLKEYIRQYPAGVHMAEAQFYLGNCSFDAGNMEEAYAAYVTVLDLPAGEFSEAAALGAATIAWNRGTYREALSHYESLEALAMLQTNRLEASIGQMRCHYLLGQENEAADFAARVMFDPATPDDIRRTATLWNARIACNKGQHAMVEADLKTLVTYGGSAGAEAKYLLAEAAFNADNFEGCEQILFELIEQFFQQGAWKNKGFLLLVRTYIGMGDLFQARATATSILTNVSDPAVQEAVSDLILEIDALEAAPITPESNNE